MVWASPEWSGIYRRIHFDKLDGKTDLNMRHVLKPTEGGLGWVDTWCLTSGVTGSEKYRVSGVSISGPMKFANRRTVSSTSVRRREKSRAYCSTSTASFA